MNTFNFLCFLVGISQVYRGLFVTIASENFGTNIRSNVTITVPNFVRGANVLITLGFEFFSHSLGWGMINGAIIIGVVCFAMAINAAYKMDETFGKDLDYVEPVV